MSEATDVIEAVRSRAAKASPGQKGGAASAAPVSADDFRSGMRRLAGGVCVLTSELDGEPVGLTATAVTSLCAEPPRLLACVNKNVFAHAAIVGSGSVCINVLPTDAVDLAKRFAGMLPGVAGDARFEGIEWHRHPGGAPVLDGALVSFQCHVGEIVPANSHSILICDVVGVVLGDAAGVPLVYANGQFRAAAMEV